MVDVDALEHDDEMVEERKAADGKPRKLTVEVTELPKVQRTRGLVTSVVVKGKARFKGDITLRMRGDVASAYWSVTPGMQLVVLAIETGDKTYDAEHVDLLPAT